MRPRVSLGQQEELMIRDKLVFGVRDERAKERLLREGEVTLQGAPLDICHASESSKRQIEGMKGDRQVHAVEKRQASKQTKAKTTRSTVAVSSRERSQTQAICEYCGKKHASWSSEMPSIWQDLC